MREMIHRRWRWIVIAAYLAVVITTLAFHEPWFDEAQAWLIARDASYHDMILVLPHYEGHPPLWWLILSVPAKLGVSYEIGLKSVQLLCATAMVSVLVFRCPFPAPIVALLPFTYFLCYQYGATARPYALMLTAMFLSAIAWKDRDSRPFRLVLSLVLLCLTSSFGLALACGIAVSWIVIAIREEGFTGAFTGNWPRIVSQFVLLSTGILVALSVTPYSDTYATTVSYGSQSLLMRIATIGLVLPSESFMTSYTDDVSVYLTSIPWSEFAICAVISALAWTLTIRMALRRHLLILLLVPYACLGAVAVFYFSGHHEGIVFAYFLTILWICADQRPFAGSDVLPWIPRIAHSVGPIPESGAPATSRSARGIMPVMVLLLLVPSLCWSSSSIVCDLQNPYSGGRALADFIIRNDLRHGRWVSEWPHDFTGSTKGSNADDTHSYSVHIIAANPYFDVNLLSCAYQGRSYLTHEYPTKAEADREIAKCASLGEPDFVIGGGASYYIRRLGFSSRNYTPYVVTTTTTPWKNHETLSMTTVFIRNDVYGRLSLSSS